jgi:hypothetical protein
LWRWRAGLLDESPPGAAEPYALQIAGDWTRAAELWTALGCPYEAALALGDADDENALRQGLDELQRLGGDGRRRRSSPAGCAPSGARGLPRGPRPATKRNPAGLHRARGGGPRARGGGADQRGDRQAPVPLLQDGSRTTSRPVLRKLGAGRAARPAPRPSGWGSPLKIGRRAPSIRADRPMRERPEALCSNEGPRRAVRKTKERSMSHSHRKALGTGLATTLAVGAVVAPGALAEPRDLGTTGRSRGRSRDAGRQRPPQPRRPRRTRRGPTRARRRSGRRTRR